MSADGRHARLGTSDGYPSDSGEVRDPGSRRRKLAGYIRAANEIRQNYTQGWARPEDRTRAGDQSLDFANSVAASTGEEQLVLFPSYAKRHILQKPTATPGTIQQVEGTGRDSRDTVGSGDAEFWKRQWEKYEDDKAIVDVDVRGWIFSPQKGVLNRRQRLMLALARQLVGIQAPAKGTPSSSPASTRPSSPTRRHSSIPDEELAAQEAAEIIRRGETEAELAGQGRFSEMPSRDSDEDSIHAEIERRPGLPARQATAISARSSSPAGSLPQASAPGAMSAAELAVANDNLVARLRPFMANPVLNTAVNAFFYNETTSRQKTVMTDSYGHFSFRAALDFVPTHVRVMAMEHLSIVEPVKVVTTHGVSLISDVDDTIRHSAITRGAREIFRNAFIRNLADLTIEGVKAWYNKMADMGVQVHYVSNSPWQLFPVLTSFFTTAGLPQGSFHLKQYSGMLQGIFEPVAERKKSTLDRIMRDFPDRKFLLVGDSGEADLEVYTDVVQEHPGRVLGVFIRDVTTPTSSQFFDTSGPVNGSSTPMGRQSRNQSVERQKMSMLGVSAAEEKQIQKAITASLEDADSHGMDDRASDIGDLIDFSDDTEEPRNIKYDVVRHAPTVPQKPRGLVSRVTSAELGKPPPPVKPQRLRSTSSVETSQEDVVAKTPPRLPRRPSASVKANRGGSFRRTTGLAPDDGQPADRQTYRGLALQKLNAAYNALPAASSLLNSADPSAYHPEVSHVRPTNARALSSLSPSAVSSRTTTNRNGALPTRMAPTRSSTLGMVGDSATAAGNRLSSYWHGSEQLPGGAAASGSSQQQQQQQPQQQPVNKREEMWKRRWRRAREIMDADGVVLRTWRVGADVMDDCVKLVRTELDRVQKHERNRGQR